MSSRDITGQVLRTCFGAVRKGVTPANLLTDICDKIAFVQRDLDKTGDVDSADYYAGLIDAYVSVARMIAPIKEEKDGLFSQLLDYVHIASDEAAKAA